MSAPVAMSITHFTVAITAFVHAAEHPIHKSGWVNNWADSCPCLTTWSPSPCRLNSGRLFVAIAMRWSC